MNKVETEKRYLISSFLQYTHMVKPQWFGEIWEPKMLYFLLDRFFFSVHSTPTPQQVIGLRKSEMKSSQSSPTFI
jgi:hypothetical protein